MHVRPLPQSPSFQHRSLGSTASTQVPSPPGAHIAPSQRRRDGPPGDAQSVSSKQHDVIGVSAQLVAPHSPREATFCPRDPATQAFECVVPSQPQTGSKIPGQTPGRAVQTPEPMQSPAALAQ